MKNKRFIVFLSALSLAASLSLPAAGADAPSDWAKTEVESAISQGLVPKDLQSSYQTPITRQEFCRLAVTMVEVVEEKPVSQVIADRELQTKENAFSDTQDDYAENACALGIVNGYEDGTFRPQGSIKRQEAAKMLYETAKVLEYTGSGGSLTFSDRDDIASYAVTAVKFASSTGVMKGVEDGRFDPSGLYTRQQAYITMDRLLSVLEGESAGGEMTATQIYSQCSPAVCYVEVYDAAGQVTGTGSAFVVEENGKLVTNYHVIQDVYSARVKFPNGKTYSVDNVLAYDVKRDVAVLSISAQGLPTLPLGDSSTLVSGQTVYTIGSPQGLDNTIANGIVSATNRVVDGQEYIQTTAPISPGSSGGALLDGYGRCVGITTGTLSGQNLNFAVPINDVKEYLDKNDPITLEELAGATSRVTDMQVTLMGEKATYTGEVLGGATPHGEGRAEWADGSYYEGTFQRGMPWGKGTYYKNKDQSLYTGDFYAGFAQGDGVLKYGNGDQYEGQFAGGQMHGKGTYTFKSGDQYVGELAYGSFQGEGVYTYVTGEKYVGEFRNNKFDGYGRYYGTTGKLEREGYWYQGSFKGEIKPV